MRAPRYDDRMGHEELAKEIRRDRIRRARAQSPWEKALDGPRLYDMVRERMAIGVRLALPDADAEQVQQEVARRMRLVREREERQT